MTVLGSLTTRSRRTADRFAEASDRAGRARVRLRMPGDRPRAVHHPSDRGRLAASLRRSAGGSHRRWAAPRSTRADRTSGAELRHRFGVRIARLVETVSDDPSNLDYKTRKRDLGARVAHADSDTTAVIAPDKIAKVRELAPLPPWQLHEPNIRAKLAHYRASLKMLRRATGGRHPLRPPRHRPQPAHPPTACGTTAPERFRPPQASSRG